MSHLQQSNERFRPKLRTRSSVPPVTTLWKGGRGQLGMILSLATLPLGMLSDTRWESPRVTHHPAQELVEAVTGELLYLRGYVVDSNQTHIYITRTQQRRDRQTDRALLHSVLDCLPPCEPVLGQRPPVIRATDADGRASIWCHTSSAEETATCHPGGNGGKIDGAGLLEAWYSCTP